MGKDLIAVKKWISDKKNEIISSFCLPNLTQSIDFIFNSEFPIELHTADIPNNEIMTQSSVFKEHEMYIRSLESSEFSSLLDNMNNLERLLPKGLSVISTFLHDETPHALKKQFIEAGLQIVAETDPVLQTIHLWKLFTKYKALFSPYCCRAFKTLDNSQLVMFFTKHLSHFIENYAFCDLDLFK